MPKQLTKEQQIIRELSDELIDAQREILILDAVKWTDDIKEDFFRNKFKKLPKVDKHYYSKHPLSYDPKQRKYRFYDLEAKIQRRLGKLSTIGQIMRRYCQQYRMAMDMLMVRGTSTFSNIAQSLYGSARDVFYVGGPTIYELANLLDSQLPVLQVQTATEADEKKYTAAQAAKRLNQNLKSYFNDPNQKITVRVSDDMVADAAAGAESIRMRSDAMFSQRDIRLLEVHEGWVHLGTTLNGLEQPICTFLSKGPPACTVTQEGLAVIMEVFTFSAFPARVRRIINRILAIDMVEHGANFLEVFHFYRERGHNEDDAYALTVRVFRGSTPTGGPFTKDLSYSKGFIQIYNYIRLAFKLGLTHNIPLLFSGKMVLEDLPLLADLHDSGLLAPPKYLPPQFRDLAALSSWMSYSLFMNEIDLNKLEEAFRPLLRTHPPEHE